MVTRLSAEAQSSELESHLVWTWQHYTVKKWMGPWKWNVENRHSGCLAWTDCQGRNGNVQVNQMRTSCQGIFTLSHPVTLSLRFSTIVQRDRKLAALCSIAAAISTFGRRSYKDIANLLGQNTLWFYNIFCDDKLSGNMFVCVCKNFLTTETLERVSLY